MVPVWATLNIMIVAVAGGMHIVITDSTYSSKDIVEVPANGFLGTKKLSLHGPVLGVVSNYMQKHC